MIFYGLKDAIAKTKIVWSPEEYITAESFKDSPPCIGGDNLLECFLHTTYDFSYQMANAQFAFTKNFNKYVEAYYIPEYSWIEEGKSTEDLIMYTNLQFDISELFARKFRKELYEKKLGQAQIGLMMLMQK